MKSIIAVVFFLFLNLHFAVLMAQKNKQVQKQEQCATMQRLEENFKRDPSLKTRFNKQLQTFNRTMANKSAKQLDIDRGLNTTGTTYTIPVVFHIVATNPDVVTNQQILAQLDVLNKDFAGTNADAAGLPTYFKPLFGKSSIQFCLAQRIQNGVTTNGIERFRSTKKSFYREKDSVKHAELGGVNIWDGNKYLNVWLCALNDRVLGYATFPNDGSPLEQGVVIDYNTLPGGLFNNYNQGKTLTHEVGHFFNLFHIWGDDEDIGDNCAGSDFVGDTPNQSIATENCPTGLKVDNCTPNGNGILYQNYMDYSFDPCLLLFTTQQVSRMETALLTYRSSLTISNSCVPVKMLDVELRKIDVPAKRICTNSFSPMVTISNKGTETLASLQLKTVIDNGTPVTYAWSGSVASLTNTTITLASVTIAQGIHTIKIFIASPNGGKDENNTDDTLTTTFEYYDAVQNISEGFEGNTFLPQGWDIVNPDQSITWKKVTGIAKTGNASVLIDNLNNLDIGGQDYLRLPELNLLNVDSAYLYFQVAASTVTPVSTQNNNWDTLEVLVSKDCGITYTSLYKKWGAELITTATENTDPFKPNLNEWRLDSVNLSDYINAGKVLLAFKNTTGNENNIYLDDINLKTEIINSNLKTAGFLVVPNPARDNITIQFFPNPAKLKSIQLYNLMGQKLAENIITTGQGSAAYSFNVQLLPTGAYFVRAVFEDKMLVKKFIKQ